MRVETLVETSGISMSLVRSIIIGVLMSTSILWWVWIVYSSLGQLRKNQIGFIELIYGCFRSFIVTLLMLTMIEFL